MTRFVPKFSKKAGHKPGSVVYVGREQKHEATIDFITYDASEYSERRVENVAECFPLQGKPAVSWIKINGVHEIDNIEQVGAQLGLHPLTLEDIANTAVRPMLEEVDGKIVVLLKRISFDDTTGRLHNQQVAVIFGKRFVVTFQEQEGTPFRAVRERIQKTVPRVRFLHADYLAYALIDTIVDDYFATMEKLGEELEQMQDELIADPTPAHLETIFEIKRELIFFRKSVWPLREVIGGLVRSETKLIDDQTDPYLRDLYDHTIQVIDTIETLRDMAASLLDIYLSSVSNRMNEVMKVLTIIGTIFIPLGFLAGVYGMNFDSSASPWNLPELGFRFGYPMFWLIALVVGVGLLVWFKRRHWL